MKRERKKRVRSRLMGSSIRILTAACVLVAVAYCCNYIIIHKWYRAEAVDARRDFFHQLVAQSLDTEKDLEKTVGILSDNTIVLEYLNAEILGERWDKRDEVGQLAASLIRLNDRIEAVCICNSEGAPIAMFGTTYAPIPEIDQSQGLQLFSDRVTIEGESNTFFYVEIPVYQRMSAGTYGKAGSVALLLRSSQLQETLNLAASAYSGEDNYFAIVDRRGGVLAESGNRELWEEYQQTGKDSNEFLYFQEELDLSKWRILHLTRKNFYLYEYMNPVQIINGVTWIAALAALVCMCFMMYRRVIRPLRKQLEFVVNYTRDMSQRLEVRDKTEMGELEKEINEMLDGIEALNKQILREHEKYLRLEYAKRQTEMIAYKNQINPHFMYNTLECIRGMALYRGEKEIASLTTAMSRMFQYNVKGKEIVTVKEALRAIQDYAVIISYRFMGKIEVETQAQQETLACTLPKMLVQPLVENAVYHGVEKKRTAGRVELRVFLQEARMILEIEDNGVGMDPETLRRQREKFEETASPDDWNMDNSEIGVANVARRLRLFYGESAQVLIQSKENEGTLFRLNLPVDVEQLDEKGEEYVSGIFGG